ncbi:hypothetical protein C2869_01280 [Saccharobesus litoralis]|uniref:Uncharacterized protein n=1 Tax=Saccharobesus litoralis TaxID=2172099 RepID=A0A2S0VLS5_9ALTE|nr:hypothetical protein C2869_01280 [Saccharobesus litoralis]
MEYLTKSKIASLAKIHLALGVVLYFCILVGFLLNSIETFADIWFGIRLAFLLSFVSFVIGLIYFCPVLSLLFRCSALSYFSVSFFALLPSFILYCFEPVKFYLFSMVASLVLGLSFYHKNKHRS